MLFKYFFVFCTLIIVSLANKTCAGCASAWQPVSSTDKKYMDFLGYLPLIDLYLGYTMHRTDCMTPIDYKSQVVAGMISTIKYDQTCGDNKGIDVIAQVYLPLAHTGKKASMKWVLDE